MKFWVDDYHHACTNFQTISSFENRIFTSMLQQYIACKSAFTYLIALESKILRGNTIFLKIRFIRSEK